MRRNSTSTIGALHPVLFMLLVYIISVVLAFFVCRMIYFSIHPDQARIETTVENAAPVTAAR
jgi:hypothetical protein